MESLICGAMLRLAQATIQAAPTILVGLLVAGIFRQLLGHAGTRKLFGDNTWRALPQAWLIGMLLPVCSLGVIPVVREMKRAGVSGGTILAFGLTAPLFNPISVLYGLTLSSPLVIFTFSLCSLLIVTIVGWGWDKLFPNTAAPEPEPLAVPHGIRRMLAVAIFCARDLAGPTSLYVTVGLIGVAAMSLLLPHGCLQTSAEHHDIWAPLVMTFVAIPAYATPMTAMVQLASMFQHGNSVGAAFALLVLGAGANLGLVAWVIYSYGFRNALAWFAMLVGIVVLLAYGIDKPLYPTGVEPAGHTHAFDIYCAPFFPDTPNVMQRAWNTLEEKSAVHEFVTLVTIVVMFVFGLVLQYWDRGGAVEHWLTKPSESKARFDFELPKAAMGGIALVCLTAMSILGCYIYYPSRAEIFAELRIVNAEVVSAASSKDWDTALYWIPIYDDWTRKLHVSMFLRGETLTPYLDAKLNVVRQKLELLEHEIEDEEVEQSQKLGRELAAAYLRMRGAFDE